MFWGVSFSDTICSSSFQRDAQRQDFGTKQAKRLPKLTILIFRGCLSAFLKSSFPESIPIDLFVSFGSCLILWGPLFCTLVRFVDGFVIVLDTKCFFLSSHLTNKVLTNSVKISQDQTRSDQQAPLAESSNCGCGGVTPRGVFIK